MEKRDKRLDDTGTIALIGFMGAGKSVVGKLLSQKLDLPFVDLDEVISVAAGKSVSEIFADEGEEGFRERESEALRNELNGCGKVLSCGGGVVLSDDNVELMQRRSRVYLLEISPEKALERLSTGSGRPLLEEGDMEERVREMMEMRAERYRSAAHAVIDANDASPEEDAEGIATEWSRYRCEQREGNTPYT